MPANPSTFPSLFTYQLDVSHENHYVVHEPTFMAYEFRLLWHTDPPFYALWTIFIGGGGGL